MTKQVQFTVLTFKMQQREEMPRTEKNKQKPQRYVCFKTGEIKVYLNFFVVFL